MNGFSEQLASYLDNLNRLRKVGASEDSLRDAFLTFLRAAFPHIQSAESILLEKHVPALRVRGGFADVLYGDLILEFKRRLDDTSRREGTEELCRYLLNQAHPDRYFGILTDGETMEVYAIREDRLTDAPVDTLRLSVENADRCKLWMDCYLFHEKRLVPTANDVALRFGERSPTFWQSIRILERLWQTAGKQPAVQTKFGEWQSLLSIVYGSEVGDERLFLRHTYLALFARSLAFVALHQRAPRSEELEEILTSAVFGRMGLDNFVGDDFFTWMEAEDIADLLHSIATRLVAAYDLSTVSEDLLKELYQELVDPQTRHDLGEFYTPDWLAELTLRRAGFPSAPEGMEPSLLDPACGSGTFLFVAVHLLREAGWKGAELARFCATQMAGLDVHPLAVIIAKTNLLLALGDDLRSYDSTFSLPIFVANAFAVAEDGGLQKPLVSVPVALERLARATGKSIGGNLPEEFLLPAEMANQPELLNSLVNDLILFANPELDEDTAYHGFQKLLEKVQIPQRRRFIWMQNLRLMRWLLEPPPADTVWRFILTNASRPDLLARRKFTFVVGNPPWLTYKDVQRNDYKQQVRRLILRRYQLLETREHHLFTQMEMATLFFAFCADHYLAAGGKIAFVMPRSIITGAQQHAKFRSIYITTADTLIDCERVAPLFNVPACVVIWTKKEHSVDQSSRSGTPRLYLEGRLPHKNLRWNEAMGHLCTRSLPYEQPIAQIASPYLRRVVQGATIVPRSLWFVCVPAEALTIDSNKPSLHTDSSLEPRAKLPWKEKRLSGSVEKDFLYSTLVSNDLVPFGWRRIALVVVPVLNGTMLNRDQAFELGYSGLGSWLKQAEAAWKEHGNSSVEIQDYVNWQNKVLRQRVTGVTKLLYNASGSHLCACVIDIRRADEWAIGSVPVKGFIADYTTYWLETDSADEAHYLCATLNSRFVNEHIKPFQPKGLFGAQKGQGERHITALPFKTLPIPLFDPQDERHLRLARLSQDCHEHVRTFLAEEGEKVIRASSGRLRQTVRELLKEQLDEIDGLVKSLLGGV